MLLKKLPDTAFIHDAENFLFVRFHTKVDDKIVCVKQKCFYPKTLSKMHAGCVSLTIAVTLDKEQLWKKATAWRNKTYIRLVAEGTIQPYRPSLPTLSKLAGDNTSGVIGVFLSDIMCNKRDKRTGTYKQVREYSWVCTWVQYFQTDEGVVRKERRRSFAIGKWGYDVAFENACSRRRITVAKLNTIAHTKLRDKYMEEKHARNKS